MAFRVTARLQGQTIKEINRLIEEGAVEPANRITAKALARVARNNFRRLTKNTGTGQTLRDIKAMKSRYSETGWIFGVLGNVDPPGGTKEWLRSTGARALFFEHGRSAPGRGRDRKWGLKSDPKSKRAQPPRPFLRPTLNEGKRKFGATTQKEIDQVLKRVSRGRIPKKVIRQIVR